MASTIIASLLESKGRRNCEFHIYCESEIPEYKHANFPFVKNPKRKVNKKWNSLHLAAFNNNALDINILCKQYRTIPQCENYHVSPGLLQVQIMVDHALFFVILGYEKKKKGATDIQKKNLLQNAKKCLGHLLAAGANPNIQTQDRSTSAAAFCLEKEYKLMPFIFQHTKYNILIDERYLINGVFYSIREYLFMKSNISPRDTLNVADDADDDNKIALYYSLYKSLDSIFITLYTYLLDFLISMAEYGEDSIAVKNSTKVLTSTLWDFKPMIPDVFFYANAIIHNSKRQLYTLGISQFLDLVVQHSNIYHVCKYRSVKHNTTIYSIYKKILSNTICASTNHVFAHIPDDLKFLQVYKPLSRNKITQ